MWILSFVDSCLLVIRSMVKYEYWRDIDFCISMKPYWMNEMIYKYLYISVTDGSVFQGDNLTTMLIAKW